MFGIGMPEMLLILAVALIVIGPKKLPDLAKSLGKALGEFKKATSELKESIQIDSELKEVKTAFNDINRDLKETPPIVTGDNDENPAEAAAPEDAPESGKPQSNDTMDELKTAFNRSQAEPQAPDAGDPDEGGAPGASPPDSETRKE